MGIDLDNFVLNLEDFAGMRYLSQFSRYFEKLKKFIFYNYHFYNFLFFNTTIFCKEIFQGYILYSFDFSYPTFWFPRTIINLFSRDGRKYFFLLYHDIAFVCKITSNFEENGKKVLRCGLFPKCKTSSDFYKKLLISDKLLKCFTVQRKSKKTYKIIFGFSLFYQEYTQNSYFLSSARMHNKKFYRIKLKVLVLVEFGQYNAQKLIKISFSSIRKFQNTLKNR